jgi:hypothetical protein
MSDLSPEVTNRKRGSDGRIEHIRRAIQHVFPYIITLTPSTPEEDRTQNFDYSILMDGYERGRVATRVYPRTYPNPGITVNVNYTDFPLVETELPKLKRGLGDLGFFGWGPPEADDFAEWVLYDIRYLCLTRFWEGAETRYEKRIQPRPKGEYLIIRLPAIDNAIIAHHSPRASVIDCIPRTYRCKAHYIRPQGLPQALSG